MRQQVEKNPHGFQRLGTVADDYVWDWRADEMMKLVNLRSLDRDGEVEGARNISRRNEFKAVRAII